MSDIWDEFEKIAVAQGLVVEAEEDGGQRKTPVRYDSLSDDAVRMLYNVEPESIFKEKDIIEVAHPETAVVTRTYDAMNAVVENVNQRQDMMAYIAQKMPNGHLTYRRYVAAKQELLNSLIRAAFTLDNQDDEKLMAFADSCAERLEKKSEKIVKEAIAPLAVGLIGGAAALLGAGWYALYGAESVKNVYVNAQAVLEALRPLMSQPYARKIYSEITTLMTEARKIYPLFPELRKIRSIEDSVNTTKVVGDARAKAIEAQIQAWIKLLESAQMKLPVWVAEIEEAEDLRTDEDTGIWSRLKNIADPLYDTASEKLVGALQGRSNWLGEGTSGGLQDALAKDYRIAQSALAAGQQQQQEIQRVVQEEQMQQLEQTQTQPEQDLFPQFEPVPAPAPSMPGQGGGVARKNPGIQEGFDPTGPTWR